MLFARVYFPFALGYAISYFYRNTNAIIESDLVNELGLGPADLGLLTGAYFFHLRFFSCLWVYCSTVMVRGVRKRFCFYLPHWGRGFFRRQIHFQD